MKHSRSSFARALLHVLQLNLSQCELVHWLQRYGFCKTKPPCLSCPYKCLWAAHHLPDTVMCRYTPINGDAQLIPSWCKLVKGCRDTGSAKHRKFICLCCPSPAQHENNCDSTHLHLNCYRNCRDMESLQNAVSIMYGLPLQLPIGSLLPASLRNRCDSAHLITRDASVNVELAWISTAICRDMHSKK